MSIGRRLQRLELTQGLDGPQHIVSDSPMTAANIADAGPFQSGRAVYLMKAKAMTPDEWAAKYGGLAV